MANLEPSQDRDLHILRLIDEGTAHETGAAFFRELVRSLAAALESRFAFVSRFCDDNTRVHVLAMWNGTGIEENFDYPLPGSPCEHVLNGDIVAFNANIQELFPAEREALKEMDAEAYLAIPLKNRSGQVLGHLAVIDTAPKNWQERDFGILRIFAARSTAEIERQLAEQEMAQANIELARRVQMEALLAETSTRFITVNPDGIDAEITRALGAMAHSIGCDRAMVFQFAEDQSFARMSHDWSLLPSPPRAKAPQLHRDDVPEVLEHFLRRQSLNVARPELLPEGFRNVDCLLGGEPIISRLAVPMAYGDATIGFICFHSLMQERHWPSEDLRMLRLLGEIVAGALMRRQTEHVLETARDCAESANRAKSEFLASMSHELRTPLNGILGYAQLLRRDPTLATEQLESVEAIESCGEHLLTLISDVLDLAKIEAGRMELDPGPVTMEEFLRELCSVARVRAGQAALRFTFETASALPEVVIADERKLRQVLLNLLGNAVKFTDRGSVTFRVSAKPLDAQRCLLHFEVEDTGIGIDSAEIERIFDPFHQVRQRERAIEGTGLGLAISRKLVALMNGTLSVKSTPGSGTTFAVYVDVQSGGHGARHRAQATPPIVAYKGRRRRILVADDKADNRQILTRLLKSLEFEVDEAPDGAVATGLALTRKPDLIFMDLVMPVRDGFDAIRDIRSAGAESARIPIVAVSASAFDSSRADSLRAGCDAFIAKPIKLDEITDTLGRLLQLDWIRNPSRGTTAATSWRLPQGMARELYELALSGDVQTLHDKLADLRQKNAPAATTVDHLAALADAYDMKALRDTLRPLAESS